MVGVQLREGAGGDEVDDAAGVHRVAAQVNSSIPPSRSHASHRTHRRILFHVHTSPYACMHAQLHVLAMLTSLCFLPFCQEEQRLLTRCLHLQRSHKVGIFHDSWQ
uniref:Uncharacterized protein n=1 Tax=Arundo donax TaxID=35708 RepID=A0A0A8XUN0_ARUDO